jgi:hypothetical protein
MISSVEPVGANCVGQAGLGKTRTLARAQGTRRVVILRGLQSFGYVLASRTAALATIAVILLAVVGNPAGEATDAALAQWISPPRRI